jgi:GT2 family glycosyltransferase
VSAPGGVAVAIVTFESERWLAACLDALAAQEAPPSEVVVVDNASRDGAVALARRHPVVSRVDVNRSNLGFAAAQNQAIRATRSDWVLVLNPDAVLTPSFLAELGARARPERLRLGTLCGKLRRLGEDLSPIDPPVIDCTGIVFTREFRHLDRGSGEPDRGQWEREEEVFGASGAAALYRRDMIDDVSIEGEFFDEAFFAYREDADVAWRARLLGWDCLYVPTAVGYHVRRVVPERRRELPAMLNRHSVKNRFLMRIKNADGAVWRRCGARGVLRDAAVVAGCLAWEWSSLPALADVARLWPRAQRQRREIQRRRRRSGDDVARWFE